MKIIILVAQSPGLDFKLKYVSSSLRRCYTVLWRITIVIHDSDWTGTVLEFCVDNLDVAKERLVSKGCQIIKWEEKGKDCYLKDPFGVIFNLWEENIEK